MALTIAQQRALAAMPKVVGSTSFFFSSLIVYTVVRDKRKRSKTYHRLVAGISCIDISTSFWLALSTWPIPRESGVQWAVGTTETCELQGFFTQIGNAGPIYNTSLSLYYLLTIRYGWKDQSIGRIEPFLHTIPLVWGIGTAVAGIPLQLFNNATFWCWIAPHPGRLEPHAADIYRWAFFYVPLWLAIGSVTTTLLLIFLHVRRIERATAQYQADFYTRNSFARTTSGENLEGRTHSSDSMGGFTVVSQRQFRSSFSASSLSSGRTRRVANQCLCYAGAFYFNWVCVSVRFRVAMSLGCNNRPLH